MKYNIPIQVKIGGFSMKPSKTGYYVNKIGPSLVSGRHEFRVWEEDAYRLQDVNIEETISQIFDKAK